MPPAFLHILDLSSADLHLFTFNQYGILKGPYSFLTFLPIYSFHCLFLFYFIFWVKASLESIRDSLAEELVSMTAQVRLILHLLLLSSWPFMLIDLRIVHVGCSVRSYGQSLPCCLAYVQS